MEKLIIYIWLLHKIAFGKITIFGITYISITEFQFNFRSFSLI